MLPAMNVNNNLVVNKILCVPTNRTYNDMYNRSFSLGSSPQDSANMQDFFNQQGVMNNCPISMTAAAANIGNIVKLSTTPTGKVDIPNGWGTQRLMYVLIVEEAISDMATQTHYIQGYSEYYDPTHTGILDPNMSFFINSVTTVTRTRNPYTNMLDSRVSATYNVISDPTGHVSYNVVTEPNAGMDLIRPSDVMANLYTSNLYKDLDSVAINIKSTSISNGANVSRRTNNDPLKYFTNTINAVINGKCVESGYNTPEIVFTNANGLVAEQPIANNAFIYALSRATGNLEPSSFTLNILGLIDPAVAANSTGKINLFKTGMLMRDPTQNATILDTDVTSPMLQYSHECDVAQTFINALTSNMSENLVTVLSGTFTNIQGQSILTISNIQSFLEGVDIVPYGNRVINYANSVIMPQISKNGMCVISIVFECDLLGDTTVSISVDNSPPIVYRLPTFADSLYSPVIANPATKQAILGDFEAVVDTVMSMSPDYTPTGSYTGY